MREIGAGRPRWPGPVKQRILDTAAVLQLRRAELADSLADGRCDPRDAVVAARGNVGLNRWMLRVSHDWHELLSLRPTAPLHELKISMPNNRALLEKGQRMQSIFDQDGLGTGAESLLAERPDVYLIGFAPLSMKLVDRSFAILQGPYDGDEPSLMKVWHPATLEAAWRHWAAVLESCRPARSEGTGWEAFTLRQQQIVTLLLEDLSDEAIATFLAVSVRTVRSDLAQVLRAVGARSRFAGAARLRSLRDDAG